MGCLNSEGNFEHWFGNIHLSGPCNRGCYFCIGQHMQGLDSLNNLDSWPLKNIDEFARECQDHKVNEINVTGSNTDPLLYRHTEELRGHLSAAVGELVMGLRTNGVLILKRPDLWSLYDKASISVTSLDPDIYKDTMGNGKPPDLAAIRHLDPDKPVKINAVLCPETVDNRDLMRTIGQAAQAGFNKVNVREPYGQPHIGDPFAKWGIEPSGERLGMPTYEIEGADVTYWDVHYVEVESINLYASGVVSLTYPITAGYDPQNGEVLDQSHFNKSGRVHEQWVNIEG